MTKVTHLPGRNAGTPVQTSAHQATVPVTTLRTKPDQVTHLPGRNAGTPVQTSAHQATVPVTTLRTKPDQVTRQQAIENALSMALYFVRQPGDTAANVWAATARANRALTLLKQSSQGNAPASPSNALGRA